MRIVFLANGGELALRTMRAAADTHEICAVVRPRHQLPRRTRNPIRWLKHSHHDALTRWSRTQGIPTVPARSGDDPKVRDHLDQLQPDVICIATFPWIVGESIYSTARLDTLNVHPSLLPRHRGINPYFWTYYHNDSTTGVSIHRTTAKVDSGPIIRQAKVPVDRGIGIIALHLQLSELAARLLSESLDDLRTGEAAFTEQDEASVTEAPDPPIGIPMVPFGEWDVERIWHFLAGMCPMYREPVWVDGARVPYGGVAGYTYANHREAPGTAVTTVDGWDLYCRAGVVHLTPDG